MAKNVDNAPTFIVDDNYDTVMALLTDLNFDATQLEAKRIAAPRATLDNLSFVVYTSGTTGKPKGIANPHRAPVLSYQWRWSLSDYTGGDKVACNVFFIWESIRPLLRGAATYCVSDETIYNPAELTSFVERHGVTEFLFTPTLFQNVISQMLNELESLRNNTNNNSLNELVKNDNKNKQYVKIDRSIIEDTNNDAITNIIENTKNNLNETTENNEEDSDDTDEPENSDKITKPWENLCEKNYNEKKKKPKYEDLKLELNTQMNLEPFNNDDFSEFGKFNC